MPRANRKLPVTSIAKQKQRIQSDSPSPDPPASELAFDSSDDGETEQILRLKRQKQEARKTNHPDHTKSDTQVVEDSQESQQLEENAQQTTVYQPSQPHSFARVISKGIGCKADASVEKSKKEKAPKAYGEKELSREDFKVFKIAAHELWYGYCVFQNLFPDPDSIEKRIEKYWQEAQEVTQIYTTDITATANVPLYKLVSIRKDINIR